MKGETAGHILNYSLVYCPLCLATHHTKTGLRYHLKKSHTDNEAKFFLIKNDDELYKE